MKLLVVIPTLEFGEEKNIAVGLAEEAKSNDIDVSLLVLYGGNPYKQRLNNTGIEVVNLNYKGGFGLTSFFSIRKFQKVFLKKIKEIKPDLIHSHLFLSKLMFFDTKGKINIPIIDTHHNSSPWWREGSLKSKIMGYIESYFFKNISSQTIAVNKSVHDELLQFTNISKDKLQIIPSSEFSENKDVNHDLISDKKKAYKQYEELYIEHSQPYYIKNMNTYQYI